jgi:hypothetical protein
VTRLSALAAAGALAAAACASAAPPPSAAPARDVRVGLTEWEIVTSAAVLAPGAVTLTVTNAGATAHDLRVATDARETGVPLLQPGAAQPLRVTVAAGEQVRLWCSVPGHRRQGMETTLQVAPG